MQAAVYWATGEPFFGIKPVRALKVLMVQAENDFGDTAEQLQGVVRGIQATGDLSGDSELHIAITQNIVIERVIGVTGARFLAVLESLVQLHKPDLVFVDPLFAFAGCDLIDAPQVSEFLREGLIPLAVRNKVCVHVVHHIGKPARDNNAKQSWSELDYQYLGFGSSEIQNAFRAVNILLPVSGHEGVFRLILSKRGSRAGALDIDGERTTHFPSDSFQLERCRPVYETIAGWKEDVTAARKLTDLPAAARRYLARIEELIGLKVSIVSVGPDREQTIVIH